MLFVCCRWRRPRWTQGKEELFKTVNQQLSHSDLLLIIFCWFPVSVQPSDLLQKPPAASLHWPGVPEPGQRFWDTGAVLPQDPLWREFICFISSFPSSSWSLLKSSNWNRIALSAVNHVNDCIITIIFNQVKNGGGIRVWKWLPVINVRIVKVLSLWCLGNQSTAGGFYTCI